MPIYERFASLCNERGVTPYRVGKETGIARSTLSEWKKGTYTPKVDKIKKVADYFGVSIGYFYDE